MERAENVMNISTINGSEYFPSTFLERCSFISTYVDTMKLWIVSLCIIAIEQAKNCQQ
jgi:hypothetical protein